MDNSTCVALRAQRRIVSLSFSSFLTGEPRGSRGSMIGVINGQKFGAAVLNTSVQQEARSGVPTIHSSEGDFLKKIHSIHTACLSCKE